MKQGKDLSTGYIRFTIEKNYTLQKLYFRMIFRLVFDKIVFRISTTVTLGFPTEVFLWLLHPME